jgi:catechol 2,3-dioxygenase-like lactoylglutathione lyase family enzyme
MNAPRKPRVSFDLTVLDTPDPMASATFYAELLGWDIVKSEDDWVTVRGPGGTGLAFQLAPDLIAPTWPDPAVPQQLHIDFDVDDLDEAEAFALRLGARRVEGAEGSGFRAYLDPAGHPFCLCVQ